MSSPEGYLQKVLIIQAEMKHYRVPFFTGLHAALQKDSIHLTVAYSNTQKLHGARNDRADLPQPVGLKAEGRWFFDRFLYQPLWREILRADLVIVGPEAKYLINPLLLLMSALKMKVVAFWGLGPNNHPDRSPLSECIKKHFFTCVDWWFAYTTSVADYLRQRGMPADQITDVQNATDSKELIRLIGEIPAEEAQRAKVALTGSSESRIGLYCGLIGEIKSIPMLIETARLVKGSCPEFHLVLIGNGPCRQWLESAITGESWIHYLGSKFGRESALYYKIADVFMLSGSAGLALVDSFAAGLPLMVTDIPTHPPEISYVIDGVNGRLAAHEPRAFARSIVEVISNPELMKRLREGARVSGARYTIEAMIENFRLGIKHCLASHGTSHGVAVALTQRDDAT